MTNYLRAKEANAIAHDARSIDGSFMRAETDSLMAMIAKTCATGLTEIRVGSIHPVVLARVKELGYGVESHTCSRDGDWATITWEK